MSQARQTDHVCDDDDDDNVIQCRTENILRYHGIGGGIFSGDEGMDVDDRFNILVDANIELCERVVSNLISLQNFLA